MCLSQLDVKEACLQEKKIFLVSCKLISAGAAEREQLPEEHYCLKILLEHGCRLIERKKKATLVDESHSQVINCRLNCPFKASEGEKGGILLLENSSLLTSCKLKIKVLHWSNK